MLAQGIQSLLEGIDVLGGPLSTIAHCIDSVVVHDTMPSIVYEDQGLLLACPVLDYLSSYAFKETFEIIETCVFNDSNVDKVRAQGHESFFGIDGVLINIGDVSEG